MIAIVLYKDGESIFQEPWSGRLMAAEERVVEYMRAHGADRAEVIDAATGNLKFSHPKEPNADLRPGAQR